MKLLSHILIVFLVSASCASAEDYNYVNPEIISPEFISPPPAEKTDEWNKEVKQILELQKNPNQADVDAARDEVRLQPHHFLTVLDKAADEKTKPLTFALMTKVKSDCELSVHQAKDFWKTTRPHLSGQNIKSLITPHLSNAYPSGHTACSRVWAEVLSQVVPAKRADLRAKAKQSANYRVLTGQHWPHDLVGGEQLALVFFGALQASSGYQEDLSAAKAEWTSK